MKGEDWLAAGKKLRYFCRRNRKGMGRSQEKRLIVWREGKIDEDKRLNKSAERKRNE